jgi:hypothetical protein
MAVMVVGWEMTKLNPKTFCPACALQKAKQLASNAATHVFIIHSSEQKLCQHRLWGESLH